MTIVRRQRSDNYAVIPNAAANDERLSFEARGLLVYLLAKPHDWSVSIPDLQAQGRIGRDKAYALLNELIKAGYVQRDRITDPATRRVVEYRYTVYDLSVQTELPLTVDNPVDNPVENGPLPDLPYPAEPLPENQDAYKVQIETNTPQPPSGGLAFAKMWERWPSEARGNRDNAGGAFERLTAAEQIQAIELADVTLSAFRRRRKRPPALVRYLRDRLFAEFDGAPPMDPEGRFIITPDRPEWSLWLGHVRRRHGDAGVASIVRLGKFLPLERWPAKAPATM